ncbi:hypothetical protein GCM10022419_063550 [Nonomuraea rosea]|uniref:CARDB domain-containing protein n=1 Tax=Nonomuraea rosea TaxID=638574 RepID=A0ABP6XXS5_9ACTN
MPQTSRLQERLGTVFLPEAQDVVPVQDAAPLPGMPPIIGPEDAARAPDLLPPIKICVTNLKQGCYRLRFTPKGSPVTVAFRGTLRVEHMGGNLRFSGDLYRFRPGQSDADADAVTPIPVHPRADYHSYLKGVEARLLTIVRPGTPCPFSLTFDQFSYLHPATGFKGAFNPAADRQIRFSLHATTTQDFYRGSAFEGLTELGEVSIRWISASYRRARVQLNTLRGAVAPPPNVAGESFATTFAKVGWELAVTDDGTIPLPAVLGAIDINDRWPEESLHALMASVPDYDPARLDEEWRVHLVCVPARLGSGRGVMFDSSLGADPDEIAREGSATFSHDGYPAADCLDGQGGSHYDAATDQQQRQVPAAFLRSATHEIGHAFNQIHTFFEAPSDNSIMSPTPTVATVIGLPGKFPDEIKMEFSPTVARHLKHLPDPAVRPGAMEFFGAAVSAPEPADMDWPDTLELVVSPAKEQVSLGEPVSLSWTLTNRGGSAVTVPASLDVSSLIARVSVTDPANGITFMRPADLSACPSTRFEPLAPGASASGSTTLYWGTDGFAFTMPGRHRVEVIVMWPGDGVPQAVSGTAGVFVVYPTTSADNDLADLLLDPDVGKAVALGMPYGEAVDRVRRAEAIAPGHAATVALREMGPSQFGG